MLESRNMLRTTSPVSVSISLILIFLLLTDISILLNIPVFRQVFGFIFLSMPGALLLYIIKPGRLGLTEKFVLSVGLGISFVMFMGILINALYPLFGYDAPLSQMSLLISMNFSVMILALIVHSDGGFVLFSERINLKLDTKDIVFVLIPIFFIPLSVLGMHIMNITNNSAMIMALLFLIPAYVILISINHGQIPEKLYPLIILLSGLSLVLLLGMRSSHIIGADAHLEYYIFQQTISNERWQILSKTILDSCLSISVLPAMYQLFLNTNQEYLFKILYPILFSISPLVVYIISKEYLGDIHAFLASFFFMSQNTFSFTSANPRTTIAILFFSLSIMVLLNGKLAESKKRLLFIIFTSSCAVSHYSTTYIFFGILLFSFIVIQIYRLLADKNRLAPKKIRMDGGRVVMDPVYEAVALCPSKLHLTSGIIAIFFAVIFVWYSQITGAAFDSGVGFIINSLISLQDFFILESRQESVVIAFGSGIEMLDIPRKIRLASNWLAIFFIAIGLLNTLLCYQQKNALNRRELDDCSRLSAEKINIEFLSLSLICSALMIASVALPFASKSYGLDRTYLQTSVVLSSFFVIGGMTVAKLFNIRREHLVVLLVLIPFFMCETGAMYQLFDIPASISLNSKGDSFDTLYIYDQETASSIWLKNYSKDDLIIYTDFFGGSRLISQGRLNRHMYAKDLIENHKPLLNGYFYFTYSNALKKKFLDSSYHWHNISEYNYEFERRKKIYSNLASDVWMA